MFEKLKKLFTSKNTQTTISEEGDFDGVMNKVDADAMDLNDLDALIHKEFAGIEGDVEMIEVEVDKVISR